MRRRLLERLQQGVERLAGELVGLVDDVDLVLALGGRESDLFTQVPHLVDAAVARRVDLDQVEEPSVADGDAVLALVARLAVLGLGAVHRLRDEPRDGRLADAARSGEEVGMRDLPRGDRVAERARHMLLSDDR